jgi:hypothetical protein
MKIGIVKFKTLPTLGRYSRRCNEQQPQKDALLEKPQKRGLIKRPPIENVRSLTSMAWLTVNEHNPDL